MTDVSAGTLCNSALHLSRAAWLPTVGTMAVSHGLPHSSIDAGCRAL